MGCNRESRSVKPAPADKMTKTTKANKIPLRERPTQYRKPLVVPPKAVACDTVSFHRSDEYAALTAPFDMKAMKPVVEFVPARSPIRNSAEAVQEKVQVPMVTKAPADDAGKYYIHVSPSKKRSPSKISPPKIEPAPVTEKEVTRLIKAAAAPQKAPIYVNLFNEVQVAITEDTKGLEDKQELVRSRRKPITMLSNRPITMLPFPERAVQDEVYLYTPVFICLSNPYEILITFLIPDFTDVTGRNTVG